MSAPSRATSRSRLYVAASGLALLGVLGCGGPPTPIGNVITTTQAGVDLLRSITDPASATVSIDKIKSNFTELANADAGLLTYMSDPAKVLSLMSEGGKSIEQMARLKGELGAELDRIDKLKGLPVEFWNVLRVESYKLVLVAAGADPDDEGLAGVVQRANSLYQQVGPQRIVEFNLTNATSGDPGAAIKRIGELAGADAQIIDLEDPDDADVMVVIVGPVNDFDKLVASVDFGEVTDQEKAKGEATIELPEAAPATEVADQSDQAAPDALAEQSGELASPDAAGEYGGEQPGAPPAEGPSRLGQVMGVLSAMAQAQQEAAVAKAAAGPQPGDRDYHAQLAELLFDPQSPHHERALTALLEAKPKDVADKKVRARIATGYRHVAFETSAHIPEAVAGLVKWGGKFSQPVLIELLEKQSTGAEEAVYDGLATLATPESAAAVVARLANGSSNSDAAFSCLAKMGPVAEASLIGALPFESPETNRAAIEVLGKIGSKKSTAILRKATKSENAEVKEAALAALRAIRDRDRKDK